GTAATAGARAGAGFPWRRVIDHGLVEGRTGGRGGGDDGRRGLLFARLLRLGGGGAALEPRVATGADAIKEGGDAGGDDVDGEGRNEVDRNHDDRGSRKQRSGEVQRVHEVPREDESE